MKKSWNIGNVNFNKKKKIKKKALYCETDKENNMPSRKDTRLTHDLKSCRSLSPKKFEVMARRIPVRGMPTRE